MLKKQLLENNSLSHLKLRKNYRPRARVMGNSDNKKKTYICYLKNKSTKDKSKG